MAKLITVFWRDIPAQIIAKQGRKSVKVMMSERFQVAIDRAAMRAGKGSSEAYLEEWRRETRSCTGDLTRAAQSAADLIESEWTDQQLDAMARNKGVATTTPPAKA